MASLDDEFARFEAELKSLEQHNTAPERAAEEGDAASKKRARDEDATAEGEPQQKKKAESATAISAKKSGGLAKPVTTETVVIRAAPKVYMAPPRPAPAKKAYNSDIATSVGSALTAASSYAEGPRPGVPNTIAAVEAHRGALSGFPVGVSGEYAARSATTAAAPPRPVAVPRMDMVTGQFLSAEEQHMMNQQQSVYEYDPNKQVSVTSGSQSHNGVSAAGGHQGKNGKQKRHLRLAGGEVWEDQTLAEWPENDFRLFCGDLGNEVSDELLAHSFSRYASFQRAKVVRDKLTHKSRGYGFVSFTDPFDCAKALREMNGKYIGNRPVKLTKSKWEDRNIDVAKKKMKRKNRHLFS
uniref:RRM domain-containing protein n=1 Tax=Globisporangium ultimum (strain ATCC 200006 / CBS 805.95 / DAOM BR144) TaxID=431595 RepID=K3WS76_GLOUD